MFGWILLVLCATLTDNTTTGNANSNSAITYADALRQTEAEHRPLVVIVGAKWCASCQVMKRDTILPLQAAANNPADTHRAIVCYVDKDEQPELASKLMRGEELPQVVIFLKPLSRPWKRWTIKGLQTRNRLLELIRRIQ